MDWEQDEIPHYTEENARDRKSLGDVVILCECSQLTEDGIDQNHTHARQEERIVWDLVQENLI
jgi:hypothetical protein